jgi:hypothetical protein
VAAAWVQHRPSRVVAGKPPGGTPPSAPSSVTSVTKDGGATVSFLAPSSSGSGPVTSYTVTPYIAGAAQSPVTVAAGSAGSITGSNGSTYVQVPVTGLANGTAYTFTAHASSSYGTGPESGQSGANTPLSGLVFGDDFNGPASGPLDPEWWVYTRCGYLAQNEVGYYLPSQCILDGSSNLLLVAQHTSHTGPSYASAGGGTVTQPWISGACQSNTRAYAPAAGNTMTFEARQQVPPDSGNGFWPGLFWLEGQNYLSAWKTDPLQSGWDTGSSAEIDVAEWSSGQTRTNYGSNVFGNSSDLFNVNTSTDFSAAMHIYQARWKPGVSVTFFRDGSQTHQVTASGTVATSACQFFLLLYLQMLAGGPATTEQCAIDYVRVYDQNLG